MDASLELLLPGLLIFDALIAAAVTGYQHPSELSSAQASQFFISLLDSNNKEQRLDEKGLHSQYITMLVSHFLYYTVISAHDFLLYRGCTGQPP